MRSRESPPAGDPPNRPRPILLRFRSVCAKAPYSLRPLRLSCRVRLPSAGNSGMRQALHGVVDVGAAFENARDGLERAVEFRAPAMRPVDHMGAEEAPDAPVPFFVNRIAVDRAEHGGGADAFGQGPPKAIRLVRLIAPVERIVEAANLPVPADRCRLAEEPSRRLDHPAFAAASKLPELDEQAAPFERMARRRSARAEHRIAFVGPVDLPARR